MDLASCLRAHEFADSGGMLGGINRMIVKG